MKKVDLRRSPYARILLNAQRGMGVHLTADEVFDMSLDHSIQTRGELDLENVNDESEL